MADKGSWSATATSSELVPENIYREKLVIQMYSSDPCALGFGEDAVFTDGVQLRSAGGMIVVNGPLAREAVNGICDTGHTASGGYQEALGICG